MDTIFALATAKGRAGIAVVRISGVHARKAVARLNQDVPQKRGLRHLYDSDGILLDEALVLVFPAGQSFTGEEVVELHLHGSQAVVNAVLYQLGKDGDLRVAQAGEFTRRALENGRLTLAEVEGLADLIDAETESQRKQAIRVFSGALGALAESWRRQLLRAAALLEATIDFVDEDVPIDITPEVLTLLDNVAIEMQREADGVRMAERIRDGFEVAIIGAPNVGKSTLLNALAGRDAAITSAIAGTTRDVIEVHMDLDGLPVTLLDTAGLRETAETIEALGIAKAKERADGADLRLHLMLDPPFTGDAAEQDDLCVKAKVDEGAVEGLYVSGVTGNGIDKLVAAISERLHDKAGSAGIAIRERHRLAMIRAIDHLTAAQSALTIDNQMPDLIAEDIRNALRAVESIIGYIDVEHILDEIFASFCIGK